ncbi:MAG: peptidylprolyl isomerase [Clostridiales bacterium]|nr:peptidylprolyl isomerase [Clostridiales bacterium]
MSQEQNGQEKKLKQYQIIIIIVAVLIILGVAAFFIIRGIQPKEEVSTLQTVDTGDSEEASVTEFQIGLEDVVATVNGADVTGDEVLTSYEHVVNYYGEPDAESLELYYAVAMEEAVTLKLIKLTAAEMGVDQFTQEELDELYATSDSEWEYALDNYVSYNLTETDETTDEDRASAYAAAEEYYGLMGYTKDILRESYVDNEVFERVKDELCKDVAVTDEEVQAYYDEAVESDKDIYEFDIDAYENQLLMYQYGYADQEPWYKPEGYRYIKHILLEVDETLMAEYTDLLARYEEQMDAAEGADGETADVEADTEETPVTAEDIDAAKAAVIASVQDTIDEINQKIADGVPFDELVAEYGTDPGMTSGDYPDGYEVSLASYGFVTEFVSAAFSVDEVGEIAEPVLSDYGVHIVQYAGDVPAGPIELTDELKAVITQNLTDDKSNAVLNEWYESADIRYTGIIRSIQQIQEDEEAEDTGDTEETVVAD